MADTVDFNHLPEIKAAIHKAAVQLVKKAAFDVQAAAMSKAPVATGYMKSSVYTVTSDASTYGAGVVGGGPGSYLLPQVPKPPTDEIAYVAVGANYGIYVEYGTSRMAAQPYLTPAADAVRPGFLAAFERLEDYIKAAK
jgi:HK97 gp10 family phage protein